MTLSVIMLIGAFAAEQPESKPDSMQPAPDKANTDNSESLFDFLDGDQNTPSEQSVDNAGRDNGTDRPRRVATGGDNDAEKPFPVIRKPVSVSRTGPLKAPRPGDPVEPPPALTDGVRKADAADTPRRARPQTEADLSELDDMDLGELDLDFAQDEWPSSDNWTDKSYRPVPVNYEPARTSIARKIGYVLAFALIACGTAYALIGVPSVQQWTESVVTRVKETINGISSDALQSDTITTDSTLVPDTEVVAPVVDNVLVSTETNAPKTLNELFREKLSQLEVLLQNGSLDAAEQAIQDMDRSVYGYGAPEFTEIKERIAAIRQGNGTQPELTPLPQDTLAEDPLTEQQLIQQQASQLEQEELARAGRQAAEAEQAEAVRLQAEQAEAARVQAEQAEAARLQAEQAEIAQQQRAAEIAAEQQRAATVAARLESERAEEQRIAQEAERARAQQAELERAAAEAAQIRADRVAQDQARQEQLALALQQRAQLEQQRTSEQSATDDANRPSDWQVVTPDTGDRTVQQLAASQREAARQQRLVEARQREEQTAGSLPPTAVVESIQQNSAPEVPDTAVALAEPEPTPVPEPRVESTAPAPITDADLQQVYGQFAQLQDAIESRDINTVISLTQRSGARIQQVMQMFENNVAITAKLRNVSTLDAAGEIQGTLQITRLERADGAVTGPPLNFSSVRLSSVRDGDGWSSISW